MRAFIGYKGKFSERIFMLFYMYLIADILLFYHGKLEKTSSYAEQR